MKRKIADIIFVILAIIVLIGYFWIGWGILNHLGWGAYNS